MIFNWDFTETVYFVILHIGRLSLQITQIAYVNKAVMNF